MKSTPVASRLRSHATPIIAGTLVAQVVGVSLLPLVIRVVDPGPFAEYSAIVAASMVVGSVASLRLEALLPQLPAHGRPIIERVSLTLALAVSAAATGLTLVGMHLASTDDAAVKALGLGTIAGITSIIGIRTYAAIARGDGRRPGSAKVAQALTLPALQIGLVLGGLRQLVALLVAEVVSRITAERALAFGLRSRSTSAPRAPLYTEVRQTLRAHRLHMLAYGPATLLNLGASQLPLIIAPGVLNASAAGIYALAHRLILIPSTLVSQGLGQAFHHQFGRAEVDEETPPLSETALRLHRRLALVVGVLFAGVAVVAPVLLPAIAPPEWAPAGFVISLLTVWASALTVASPFSSLLIVSGRQVESLVLNVIDLASKGAIGLLLVHVPHADAVTFAVAVSAVTTVIAIASGSRFLAAAGCSAQAAVPGTVVAVGLPLLAATTMTIAGRT